jgi:hypothetical protein
MRINLCALQEKRLIDRLCSLRVKGEVIEKRRMESFGSLPEKKIVVVKFRDRIIETNLDDSEFERTEIGEQIWFSPSVPERDPCNCHMFVWLIVAIAAGTLAIWAITSHSHGRTAAFLSFAAAGWIVVIAWARICSHEQNKCFRDLVAEIDFFAPEGEREQGDRE